MSFAPTWTPPPKLRDLPPAAPSTVKPLARGTYSRTGYVTPLPKGETARPGKRAPTRAEREWMDSIVRWGCVACRADGNGIVAPQVHHILRGGRRMGHLFTLPLCVDHHQDTGRPGYIARHPWKTRFEKLYGTEMELLERLRAELGAKPK